MDWKNLFVNINLNNLIVLRLTFYGVSSGKIKAAIVICKTNGQWGNPAKRKLLQCGDNGEG